MDGLITSICRMHGYKLHNFGAVTKEVANDLISMVKIQGYVTNIESTEVTSLHIGYRCCTNFMWRVNIL